jgi:D-alanyl-lipoteichoic acid acyltransferase DltB (MBOAT superfamily)
MSFVDIRFLLFFPAVVLLHFLLPVRFRWMFLLVASYGFYMAWKPEYGLLLALITVIDFIAGRIMGRTENDRTRLLTLILSLTANLGILFYFKYFNFFFESIGGALALMGTSASLPVLDIILPIGISFHIFQSVSYTIDVYRRQVKPVTHLGKFALYVSFFPQLVAGPIERPGGLLVQFFEERRFESARAADGVRLMLMGYAKKLIIADNIAPYVHQAFSSPHEYSGLSLMFAAALFAFQIYCDFSGYTDIARGSAKILGYDLALNFDRPYAATSITDFWRRWHISLSSWLRDYLYIPLGGNRRGAYRTYANLVIVFVVCGLWHGANATFIVWGLWHGLFLIMERIGLTTAIARSVHVVQHMYVFIVVTIGWVFFRAGSLDAAHEYLNAMLVGLPRSFESLMAPDGIANHVFFGLDRFGLVVGCAGIGALILLESRAHWTARTARLMWESPYLRACAYGVAILVILLTGAFDNPDQFIYFQF